VVGTVCNCGFQMSERDPESGQFLPGHAGIGGRRKGSRNKLGEAFIADFYADWQQHGRQVIETCRINKPEAYLKVVASLLPKQLEVKEGLFDGVTDEQLEAMIAAAQDALDVSEANGDEAAPMAH
jgi:hypothetical protein